jgi:membrane-bound serine protease (ClpP class)
VIVAGLTALAVRARSLPVATGAQGMTGLAGVALTELQPEGLIRVRGETWKARAARGVAAGGAVRVTGMKGLELSVEPVENPSEPGG